MNMDNDARENIIDNGVESLGNANPTTNAISLEDVVNNANRATTIAGEHLFQAMFIRLALAYDRTFPLFARRFIEFFMLISALSVLLILIYIHVTFVKSPITCLDHISLDEYVIKSPDGTVRHSVIRVEILSNPPSNYGLPNSYAKEYDDLSSPLRNESKHSAKSLVSEQYSQIFIFQNIVHMRCHKTSMVEEVVREATITQGKIEMSDMEEDYRENQYEGSIFDLFRFPINPILEKAEYWREKLSVKAMAPFRQTFNELELFAKSVFTEEKYIMEYSLEYGLLRLSPQTREQLNIPVQFVLLDGNKDQCFGNSVSRFLLQEFVGYDQIIIGSLKRLAERQNGKGYVRNVVSGEHYRFVNSWMSRTSYLAAGFIMIIFTLSVSMLLRYSHHQIIVFVVDLMRMLENNLQLSFPAAPLLTVVLALVGMEAIMSEFFNDTYTAFYTIVIIWLADQYEAICCRTYISKRHWPKYFYLYHFAFYAYHYRFNGQFSGLALLCSWLFIQHSMFFFLHHYELPRLLHEIAVRALMDNLITERTDNTSVTLANNVDDFDRSDGDDSQPGASAPTVLSPLGTGEVSQNVDQSPSNEENKNPSSHEEEQYQSCNSNRDVHQLPRLLSAHVVSKKQYIAKRTNSVQLNNVRYPNDILHSISKQKFFIPNKSMKFQLSLFSDDIMDYCISTVLISMSNTNLCDAILNRAYIVLSHLIHTVIISLSLDQDWFTANGGKSRLLEDGGKQFDRVSIIKKEQSDEIKTMRMQFNEKHLENVAKLSESQGIVHSRPFSLVRNVNFFISHSQINNDLHRPKTVSTELRKKSKSIQIMLSKSTMIRKIALFNSQFMKDAPNIYSIIKNSVWNDVNMKVRNAFRIIDKHFSKDFIKNFFIENSELLIEFSCEKYLRRIQRMIRSADYFAIVDVYEQMYDDDDPVRYPIIFYITSLRNKCCYVEEIVFLCHRELPVRAAMDLPRKTFSKDIAIYEFENEDSSVKGWIGKSKVAASSFFSNFGLCSKPTLCIKKCCNKSCFNTSLSWTNFETNDGNNFHNARPIESAVTICMKCYSRSQTTDESDSICRLSGTSSIDHFTHSFNMHRSHASFTSILFPKDRKTQR